jgi:hypothetical protein
VWKCGVSGKLYSIRLLQTFLKVVFMDARAAIKMSLDMADMVSQTYLKDMDDTDLMRRPAEGCNHVNFQIGHIIISENKMMGSVEGCSMPALPEGMEAMYSADNTVSDDAADFMTKDQLMAAFAEQRAVSLATLESLSDEQLDGETGIHYAPTIGCLLSLLGSHWLMHCGQWVVVRRLCDKPIVM